MILISAGFDAHRRDPLANLRLEAEDFGWATRRVMEIADRVGGGRIVTCSKVAMTSRVFQPPSPRMCRN